MSTANPCDTIADRRDGRLVELLANLISVESGPQALQRGAEFIQPGKERRIRARRLDESRAHVTQTLQSAAYLFARAGHTSHQLAGLPLECGDGREVRTRWRGGYGFHLELLSYADRLHARAR